jgi:hypothetical protein
MATIKDGLSVPVVRCHRRRMLFSPINAYIFVSISFEGISLNDDVNFWPTFGRSIKLAAGQEHPVEPIFSARDFLDAFDSAAWIIKIVLFLDELGELYSCQDVIRNDFLRALPTNLTSSPFNVTEPIINPYFTSEETRTLFYEYAQDNDMTIDNDVIRDGWSKASGCVAQLHLSYILAHVCPQPSGYGLPLDVPSPKVLIRSLT